MYLSERVGRVCTIETMRFTTVIILLAVLVAADETAGTSAHDDGNAHLHESKTVLHFQSMKDGSKSSADENERTRKGGSTLNSMKIWNNDEDTAFVDRREWELDGELDEQREQQIPEDFSAGFENVDNICKLSTSMAGLEFDIIDQHDLSTKRDLFNCSAKCLCEYIDRDDISGHSHVFANCADKHLHAIPLDLPSDTYKLAMSFNDIRKIHFETLFFYKILEAFHATDCYIREISNTHAGINPSLEVLDFRYNHIRWLTNGVFACFPNLRILILSGNRIQYLSGDVLAGLSNLKFLDIALNDVKKIESGTFDNLTMMESLSFSGNYHLGYDTLTARLFKGLTRLKALKIQGCSNGASQYPNEAIGVLGNLEALNIDALANPAEFGPQFGTLKHLKVLSFGPHADCRLVNMSKSYFQYFHNLTCLYIHACNISFINPKAYSSFDNLKALTINSVPSMTIDEAFKSLSGFKIKSLEYIGFINLTNWNWPCIWLTKMQGHTMVGFNLTTINLSYNRLSLLSNSFIETIPITVKKLILRYNKFTLFNIFWTSLIGLSNLSYLDVSFQNRDQKYHYVPFLSESDHTLSSIERSNAPPSSHADRPVMKRSTTDQYHSIGDGHVLNIPPNLEIVIASWYSFFGGIVLTNNIGNNSLKYLNFSRCGLYEWGKGQLPKNVEDMDLSVNAAQYIHQDFFPPDNSLTELRIQVNFLGNFIAHANRSVFRHLSKLKYLDLSTNVIFDIPYDFFYGLHEVETIRLTANRLESLNVGFEFTKNLKFLDLQKNSVSWISESTRHHLDQLALRPQGMTVDLHYNFLMCTCDYIDMLHWMAETNVYFLNMPLYLCKDAHSKLVSIKTKDDMRLQVKFLRHHCYSYGYMVFGLVAIALIFTIAITIGVVYRYRWWIRYKKHVLFAKWFGFKPQHVGFDDELRYKYDAFLLYVRDDRSFALTCSNEMESVRNHKFCIGDRDILPGTNEIAGIVSAIQNSRLTLVAVTDNFVSDMGNKFQENPMLDYALQMALMEEYCTKRQTLHLILTTSNDDVKYPPYILKVFRDECVTGMPSDSDAHASEDITDDMFQTFWDKLSFAIGHATRCTQDTEESDDDDDLNSFHSNDIEGNATS